MADTSRRIAVLPGDGSGREVVPEALKVLRALTLPLEFEEYEVGAEPFLRGEPPLGEAAFQAARHSDAILFGAVGDPRIADPQYQNDVILALRFRLDLYVNLRPARLYHERLSPYRDAARRGVDLLIVRENSEGPYVGSGGRFRPGTEHEVAIQEDINTHGGVSRIIRHAFTRARREVCLVDKSNALRHAGALWQERWEAIRGEHPETRSRHLYVDACALELVRDPTQFDVLVTGNLFGDILSDLTAGLIGGIGLAPSANVNPETGGGLFEPIHGSAPTIAGQGIVNPVGAILSSAMLLQHVGFADAGARVEAAVSAAVAAGECTRDLGGNLSTAEAGDAVLRRLGD
jgi:3-isopropylmalate dehydrogenase